MFRKYSGIVPEPKLKNWKPESIWRISFWISLEKTVFQFFSFGSGTIPEILRNEKISWWWGAKPGHAYKHQYLFISGAKTEKLKNWKNESIWRISSWISLEKTVFQFFQFFNFSVFHFFSFFQFLIFQFFNCSVLVPELFRKFYVMKKISWWWGT